jgi:thioredoxin-like negative regulator of GroEL
LEELSLLVSIGLEDFQRQVIEERRPVLVACIHLDSEFKEQREALEGVSRFYGEALKVCLLDEDSIGALREKLGIGGTPAFVILYGGKERDRMLGKVDSDTLRVFVLRALPKLFGWYRKKPCPNSRTRTTRP